MWIFHYIVHPFLAYGVSDGKNSSNIIWEIENPLCNSIIYSDRFVTLRNIAVWWIGWYRISDTCPQIHYIVLFYNIPDQTIGPFVLTKTVLWDFNWYRVWYVIQISLSWIFCSDWRLILSLSLSSFQNRALSIFKSAEYPYHLHL